jgi:tRNA-splicing ligase RtcB
MKTDELNLKKMDDTLWEIEKQGPMNVPGRIYANDALIGDIKQDDSMKQVANVATLPGIEGYSYAMPDIHWGYGFPIGGVAAFDKQDGIISPGGVGYDINCGVRFVRTNLSEEDVAPNIKKVVGGIFNAVPSGVGSSGAIGKISISDERELLKNGASWAVDQGFGRPEDLKYTEDQGRMTGADPDALSDRALERGRTQIGTLGSGNHFLEVDVVDQIFDGRVADELGLEIGQVILQIHSGSRGLGYQVCDDHVKDLVHTASDYGIHLEDKQLACAPAQSPEGQKYRRAMACAANYAWVNRQVMMHNALEAVSSALSLSHPLDYQLIYDVCHNIAKVEEHEVNGTTKDLIVHRKGATRSLPPGHELVPEPYKDIGQPVLVPGDMGSSSYLLVGSDGAPRKSFGSACHGAGRAASRTQMKKQMQGKDLNEMMSSRGVYVKSDTWKGMAEEMPDAYKDVSRVVDAVQDANLARKVVRVRPIGVAKG